MKKRIKLRKTNAVSTKSPFKLWALYLRGGAQRPFRNHTLKVKVLALSVSVATMAFIFNYIKPNIEYF